MDLLKKHARWVVPVLLMVVIAPFTPWLDMNIERFFYVQGPDKGHFSTNGFLEFMYVYGLVPGQIVGTVAGLGVVASFIFPSCKRWRKHALFLSLTLLIGSGLITHALLKDHWGRPRPRQVIEFGGEQEFRPFYRPNFFREPEPSKSFPCGHCTLGFYFTTFILLGERFRKKWLLYSGFILTILLGGLLGYTRIAQGGHFFSDVLISALVMWITAMFLDWLIYEEFG